MGTFMGHVFPGSAFIIFGLWWLIQILRRFFICRNDGKKFKSSCSFTVNNFPLESTFKLVVTIAGIISEIGTENQIQHQSMYIAYGLTGFIDFLIYFRFDVPKHLDYAALCLAICMEATLFKLHLFGRDPLNTLLHSLLLVTLAAAFIGLIFEMKYQSNLLIALLRPYFTILQGTWFYQTGFILYSPISKPWDANDKHNLMHVAAVFTWHCEAVLVAVVFACCIMSWMYRKNDSFSGKYTELQMDKSEDNDFTCISDTDI